MAEATEPVSGEGAPNGNHAADGSENEDKNFQPPRDGSWVPITRLNQVLQKVDNLTQALSSERSAREAAENRMPSKSELENLVYEGRITQEEADQRIEDSLIQKVTASVVGAMSSKDRVSRNEADLAKYFEAVPALNDENTEQWQSVNQEYRHYVRDLGLPDDSGTMVAAVRSVLGPLSAIKAPAPTKGGDSYGENSGGSSGGGDGGKGKSLVSQLSAERKAYYTRAIDHGAYSNWDAVEAELKFVADRNA